MPLTLTEKATLYDKLETAKVWKQMGSTGYWEIHIWSRGAAKDKDFPQDLKEHNTPEDGQ